MRALPIIFAAFLLAFADAPAMAQESKSSGVGAEDIGETEVTRRDAALRVLKRLDAELLKVIARHDDHSDLAKALRAQQAAWRTYLPAECEFVGLLIDAASPWQSVRAVRCEANLSEQRIVRVRAALRCVQRLPENLRQIDQGACLYQLAPMAVPLRP